MNPEKKELYLSDAEFEAVFKVDKATFEKLPTWKRVQVRYRVVVAEMELTARSMHQRIITLFGCAFSMPHPSNNKKAVVRL